MQAVTARRLPWTEGTTRGVGTADVSLGLQRRSRSPTDGEEEAAAAENDPGSLLLLVWRIQPTDVAPKGKEEQITCRDRTETFLERETSLRTETVLRSLILYRSIY